MVVGIIVGLGTVFFTWVFLATAQPECSSGVCWGGDWNNFLNFVHSDKGWIVYPAVFSAAGLIAGFVHRAIAKKAY